MQERSFPKNFIWGAASSSFQIEGTVPGDGRGPSIWDDFCAQPGRIRDGSNGLVACDHYRLWPRDVELLSELGARAYRFSMAWPRIFPEGRGRSNAIGLDFYKRLIDSLLEKNITPWVTLYHWDLPFALERKGGWRNRNTAFAFADYAAYCVAQLGDRVKHWITHNEPWCVAVLGHRLGEHAPGLQNPRAALETAHHVLLSHGLAMQRIRELAPDATAGITLNLNPAYPATPGKPEDEAAAHLFDGDFNRWYLDPLFRACYPEDMIQHHENQGALGPRGWDFIQQGDLKTIAQPNDFLGVNYYSRTVLGERSAAEKAAQKDPLHYTAMDWEIHPEGLQDLFVRLARDYPVKAWYITENGAAYADQLTADRQIHDAHRLRYLALHLDQVAQVCARGIPLKGYFAWSILDNFEWAHGYEKRFGLVYVDYASQERIPKASFHWLKEVIAANKVFDVL
ncbi:GH1 family beta-glucosidase [Oligoflexus tunisiensis]|uniref:GH1 family beta-glucosidase n=1 Tax=Oligoflexus tunisiensis TaxID=708132 RepID=UPI000A5D6728|nr:GH1 family beta-glucosidase [Oligoflexus tunisiensis]